MTDLLSAFITYAASGPQEFCIAMVVPGLCVMMFGKKIEKTAKPAPKRQPKRTKRKTVKNVKNGKTRKAKPKARQGEMPKQWAKVPEYSQQSLDNIEKYQNGRWKVKPETDGWQNVGGRVPL